MFIRNPRTGSDWNYLRYLRVVRIWVTKLNLMIPNLLEEGLKSCNV